MMWYSDWILAQRKRITRKTGEVQIKSGISLIEGHQCLLPNLDRYTTAWEEMNSEGN